MKLRYFPFLLSTLFIFISSFLFEVQASHTCAATTTINQYSCKQHQVDLCMLDNQLDTCPTDPFADCAAGDKCWYTSSQECLINNVSSACSGFPACQTLQPENDCDDGPDVYSTCNAYVTDHNSCVILHGGCGYSCSFDAHCDDGMTCNGGVCGGGPCGGGTPVPTNTPAPWPTNTPAPPPPTAAPTPTPPASCSCTVSDGACAHWEGVRMGSGERIGPVLVGRAVRIRHGVKQRLGAGSLTRRRLLGHRLRPQPQPLRLRLIRRLFVGRIAVDGIVRAIHKFVRKRAILAEVHWVAFLEMIVLVSLVIQLLGRGFMGT